MWITLPSTETYTPTRTGPAIAPTGAVVVPTWTPINRALSDELNWVLSELESISVWSLGMRWAIRRIREKMSSELPSEKHAELQKTLGEIRWIIRSWRSGKHDLLISYLNNLELLYTTTYLRKVAIEEGTREKTEREKHRRMLEEIESIDLIGTIEWRNWNELKQEVIDELDFETSDELRAFETAIAPYEKYYAQLNQKVELWGIDSGLNKMAEQVVDGEPNTDGTITVTAYGSSFLNDTFNVFSALEKRVTWENNLFEEPLFTVEDETITFKDKESALGIILELKEILNEIQSTSLDDKIGAAMWSIWVAIAGWTFDINTTILDFLIWDAQMIIWWGWPSTIIAWLATFWSVLYLKNKIKEANSWIPESRIKNLVSHLSRQTELYEEAWYTDDQISHMKKLIKEIESSYFEDEAKTWNVDHQARAKYIYRMLQKYRWSVPADWFRFISSEVWWIVDGSLTWPFIDEKTWLWKRLNVKAEDPSKVWRVGRYARIWARVYFAPYVLGSKLINKGPHWWRVLVTKSQVILDYETAILNSNTKLTEVFKIVDDIEGLDSDEKKALKREILDEYKAHPLSKKDPLKRFKVTWEKLTDEERALYSDIYKSVSETKRNMLSSISAAASNMWKNPSDIPSNIRNFFSIKTIWWKSKFTLKIVSLETLRKILRTVPHLWPSYRRIDNIAADILENKIEEVSGSRPDIRAKIQQLRESAKDHEKNREAIEEVKQKYETFIKYFPEISDKNEKKLLTAMKTQADSALSEKDFEKNMLKTLENPYGIVVDKDEVKAFTKQVKTESIDTAKNWVDAKIIAESDKVLDAMWLPPQERRRRKMTIEKFFTGDKTFWQPHLSIVLERLLNGEPNYDPDINIEKYSDVKRRVDLWLQKNTLNYVKYLIKNSSDIKHINIFMEIDDYVSRLLLEAELRDITLPKNHDVYRGEYQEKVTSWNINTISDMPSKIDGVTVRSLGEIIADIETKASIHNDIKSDFEKAKLKWTHSFYEFVKKSIQEGKIWRITT